MKQIIRNKTFDEERALYNLQNALVEQCAFAGPRDGESALKEARDVALSDCRFSLRYPLWHAHSFALRSSQMDALTRAAIWYAQDGEITGCTLDGIKCLRECSNIVLRDTDAHSPEFGWKCRGLMLENCDMESEYFLFESQDVHIDRMTMRGKYSFQYVRDMEIINASLDTKDAFWHSVNVTVRDSVVKGEYLGWYSKGLTLERCRIIGTQPLCYCDDLRLIDCEMVDTDLSFEYSDVQADIRGDILSVKNPRAGRITADHIGKIILEDAVMETACDIRTRQARDGAAQRASLS